ncbi:TIGR03067 domain-containing protein [Stieleria mannarensis]|uniref:TIGR03067 domain-containing protein n=1 Tax=Stieleria mannarensis TaxID=2755585 RepID=UPI001C71D92A|nr:TIGR03067 domain-containing protein [Rhodopirellula sp. JC639]
MKSALFTLVVLALCPGAMADDSEPSEVQSETDTKSRAIEHALESFAGNWQIVGVQPPGVTNDAKRLVFRKDRTYAAMDAGNQELWSGTFDLDPTSTPKVWDHRSDESKKAGGDALGIYELEGDRLKVCCVVGVWKEKQWSGKPRPGEFKLPNADVVLELRRLGDGR